jgi:hypothetical protein
VGLVCVFSLCHFKCKLWSIVGWCSC